MSGNKNLNLLKEMKDEFYKIASNCVSNNDPISLQTLLANPNFIIDKAILQQLFFNSVGKGNLETTEVLLNYGAKINEPMPLGDTALMWAVMKNHTHLLPLLLQYGANVNAKTNIGNSALTVAIKKNITAAITILVQAGASLELLNSKNDSPKESDDSSTFRRRM